MAIIRVKPDISSSVYDEATDTRITLSAGMEFDTGDPIVKKYAWAFQTDADADADSTRSNVRQRRTTAKVEQATANPGEKRNR